MRKQYPEGTPTYDELMLPTVKALMELGGTASISEIESRVLQDLNLPQNVVDTRHANTAMGEVQYRLYWSRTYLNKYGALTNPSRGVWAIAEGASDLENLDPTDVVRFVRATYEASTDGTSGPDIHDRSISDLFKDELGPGPTEVNAFMEHGDGLGSDDHNNWFEDEGADDEDYEVKDYDITSSPNDFNMSTMVSFIESGALKIPGFQRNYVWDLKRASKLIESLIIGLPIPQIFLYEETRNHFLVIDGQQRLMSIYYFSKQRFPRKEKRLELRRIFDQNGRIPEEVLQSDEFFMKFNLQLPSKLAVPNKLNKRNYGTLDELRTTFDLRTVRNIIIKQNVPAPEDDDSSSIFEIFNRLNTGGVNLKPQEIRTSLYHSAFYEMLYRVNLDTRWRRLLGFDEPDLHMKDVEMLLRAFAMVMAGSTYAPSMTRFLNLTSKRAMKLPSEKVDYLAALFAAFLSACDGLSSNAFMSAWSMKVNVSLIDAVFTAHCSSAFRSNSLSVPSVDPGRLEILKKDPQFIFAAQFDTASTTNVATRRERARTILIGDQHD